VAAVLTPFAVTAVFVDGLAGTVQALAEYLRPTTVEMIKVRECAETNETPPADLMLIVYSQMKLHHLMLQRVVVCRSERRYPALERRYEGYPYTDEFGGRWQTLSPGCCSSRLRRHVVVLVADPKKDGSIVLEAALVQNRGQYLWLKSSEMHGSWIWRWGRRGVEALGSSMHVGK